MQRRRGQKTSGESLAEQSDDEHEFLFDLFEEQPSGNAEDPRPTGDATQMAELTKQASGARVRS